MASYEGRSVKSTRGFHIQYEITRHRQVNVQFQRHLKISMNNILLSSITTSLHEFNDISNVESLWSVVIDVQCVYKETISIKVV